MRLSWMLPTLLGVARLSAPAQGSSNADHARCGGDECAGGFEDSALLQRAREVEMLGVDAKFAAESAKSVQEEDGEEDPLKSLFFARDDTVAGGTGGLAFDHYNYNNLRGGIAGVSVWWDDKKMRGIEVNYAGHLQLQGKKEGQHDTLTLADGEYITKVTGTWRKGDNERVCSIQLHTNKHGAMRDWGPQCDTPFEFKPGNVGNHPEDSEDLIHVMSFHGRSWDDLDRLGVYWGYGGGYGAWIPAEQCLGCDVNEFTVQYCTTMSEGSDETRTESWAAASSAEMSFGFNFAGGQVTMSSASSFMKSSQASTFMEQTECRIQTKSCGKAFLWQYSLRSSFGGPNSFASTMLPQFVCTDDEGPPGCVPHLELGCGEDPQGAPLQMAPQGADGPGLIAQALPARRAARILEPAVDRPSLLAANDDPFPVHEQLGPVGGTGGQEFNHWKANAVGGIVSVTVTWRTNIGKIDSIAPNYAGWAKVAGNNKHDNDKVRRGTFPLGYQEHITKIIVKKLDKATDEGKGDWGAPGVCQIQFITNHGRVSRNYGEDNELCEEVEWEFENYHLISLFGRAGDWIDQLGVYFGYGGGTAGWQQLSMCKGCEKDDFEVERCRTVAHGGESTVEKEFTLGVTAEMSMGFGPISSSVRYSYEQSQSAVSHFQSSFEQTTCMTHKFSCSKMYLHEWNFLWAPADGTTKKTISSGIALCTDEKSPTCVPFGVDGKACKVPGTTTTTTPSAQSRRRWR